MRVAFILRSPPKKMGSLEQWCLGVVREVRLRGLALDVFTPQPVHPEFRDALAGTGAGWGALEELEHGRRLDAVRRLAGYDLVYANMVQPRSPLALRCYAAWPAKVVLVDHGSGVPGRCAAACRARWTG